MSGGPGRLLVVGAVRELAGVAGHAASVPVRVLMRRGLRGPRLLTARAELRHRLLDRLAARVTADTVDITPWPWVAALISIPISISVTEEEDEHDG